ncbi:LacI family DNA-binding transcriptional regulator [Evansella tamaricis]|uniref:LacI family DNA-binding transcriptional regulator n=1 Tax=Evansella tamaricis TaxID=2069301 RepID=A0ABS6JC30_9BACI|nr:LacI family DNA-binding transcriptional regulator [Evansella tamaricis]MBU9711229.1 LacI family DNA-binding transcriptional regulator [Evansella tamaricis]
MRIKDIAKLANVSTSAVSLALNGKPGVSEDTREKILKITNEYGYTPRSSIKTVPKGKVLRFVAGVNYGLVTEKYDSLPFFVELIHYINENISSKGYSLLISSLNSENLVSELSLLEQDQPTNGIILLGTNLKSEQIQSISENHPNVVVIDTCFETLNIDFVVMNNVMGAFEAGTYLIEQGHTKVAYAQSNTRMYNFEKRKEGFFQAMKTAEISIPASNIYTLSPTEVSSQDIFKLGISNDLTNLPTVIFCECDYIAISVIKSLAELGINVPEDISVIGFDNIWEAQIINPELTTVHVKKDRIASIAVEKVIQNISNPENERIKMLVDTKIIERSSCQKINDVYNLGELTVN